jgi:hypothetical protein
MSDLDQAIVNLETMRDEFMKASFTKDNYNSEWGIALQSMSTGLHKYASELKYKQNKLGDFNYV